MDIHPIHLPCIRPCNMYNNNNINNNNITRQIKVQFFNEYVFSNFGIEFLKIIIGCPILRCIGLAACLGSFYSSAAGGFKEKRDCSQSQSQFMFFVFFFLHEKLKTKKKVEALEPRLVHSCRNLSRCRLKRLEVFLLPWTGC